MNKTGYSLENKLIREAKDKGLIAIRSSRSLTPFDIIIIDESGTPHFFQLKNTKDGYFDKRELEKFKKIKLNDPKHFWVWKKNKGWCFKWDG